MPKDDRGAKWAGPGLSRSLGKTAEEGKCERVRWGGGVLCLAPQAAVPTAAVA